MKPQKALSFDQCVQVLYHAMASLKEEYVDTAKQDACCAKLALLSHPGSDEVTEAIQHLHMWMENAPLVPGLLDALVKSLPPQEQANQMYCVIAAIDNVFLCNLLAPLFELSLFAECSGFDSNEDFNPCLQRFWSVYYKRASKAAVDGETMTVSFVRCMWEERELVKSIAEGDEDTIKIAWRALLKKAKAKKRSADDVVNGEEKAKKKAKKNATKKSTE